MRSARPCCVAAVEKEDLGRGESRRCRIVIMVSRRTASRTRRNGAAMRCRLAVFGILLLPLLPSGIACLQVTDVPRKDGVPPLKNAAASAAPAASPAETDPAITRGRLLGTWQDHYQGTRTMT